MQRKGLGSGYGKGYRNIIGRDKVVHAQSSKGIKQPQTRFIQPLNLGKVNRLPIQVGIIVPSTRFNKKVSQQVFKERINETKEFFDKAFGGDTAVKTIGSYYDDSRKELIKEDGLLVESSMSLEAYNKNKSDIEQFIKEHHKKWEQDTILVSVEGQNFIYPYKDYIIDDDKQKGTIIIT